MSEITWLVQLGEAKAEGDIISVYNFFKRGSGGGRADLFSGSQQRVTRQEAASGEVQTGH